MNSVITTAGGFDKVVFESVIDTIAGGGTVEVSGYTNADGIIPAGTLVGEKDASTGLHPIITTTGSAGTLSGTPMGMVHATVPLVTAGNNVVGIVIEGVARIAAMPDDISDALDLAAVATAMPKITFV